MLGSDGVWCVCDVTEGSQRELDYDDVYNQAGPTNCTVYCGGIQNNLTGSHTTPHYINTPPYLYWSSSHLPPVTCHYMVATLP